MRLSVKGLAWTGAIFLGGMMFLVSLADIVFGGYGEGFLEVADTLYPGYTYAAGVGSVVVGALYGALDGAVGGALFAWIYNLFVPKA